MVKKYTYKETDKSLPHCNVYRLDVEEQLFKQINVFTLRPTGTTHTCYILRGYKNDLLVFEREEGVERDFQRAWEGLLWRDVEHLSVLAPEPMTNYERVLKLCDGVSDFEDLMINGTVKRGNFAIDVIKLEKLLKVNQCQRGELMARAFHIPSPPNLI